MIIQVIVRDSKIAEWLPCVVMASKERLRKQLILLKSL